MEMERSRTVLERPSQVQQYQRVAHAHGSNTVATRGQRAIQVLDGRRPARILQAGHAYRPGFRGADSSENSEEAFVRTNEIVPLWHTSLVASSVE